MVPWGEKKAPKWFFSNFVNFLDIFTLIHSNERKFYEVLLGINFIIQKLLFCTQQAQNQKWQKFLRVKFVPLGSKIWIFSKAIMVCTSLIKIGDNMLIPDILSHIVAGDIVFRPFYKILKNGHFLAQNCIFLPKKSKIWYSECISCCIDYRKSFKKSLNLLIVCFLILRKLFFNFFSLFWNKNDIKIWIFGKKMQFWAKIWPFFKIS